MGPPPRDTSPPAPGILSNVLSFVSREFESFVHTATGAEPKPKVRPLPLPLLIACTTDVLNPQAVPRTKHDADQERPADARKSKSRSRSDARRRSPRDRSRAESRRRRSASRSRRRSSSASHADSESESPAPRRRTRSHRSPPPRSRSRSPLETDDRREQEGLMPPPPPAAYRPRSGTTMPGSLFPRSPSMMPDSPPLPVPGPDDRRVRFASRDPSSTPQPAAEEPEVRPSPEIRGDARRREGRRREVTPEDEPQAGPSRVEERRKKKRRKRADDERPSSGGAASVRDGAEDAALMPPPPLPKARERMCTKEKRKGRALSSGTETDESDTPRDEDGADEDAVLMPPPPLPKAREKIYTKEKRKRREPSPDPERDEGDTPRDEDGTDFVDRDAALMPPPPLPKAREKIYTKEKRKRREPSPDPERDEGDTPPDEDVPTKSAKAKGKERAWDTSGELRVRGKEQELRAVREASVQPSRDSEERERDKARIRMLEQEIAQLKAQLAAAARTHSSHSSSLMPPPPPPPPPPPNSFPPAPTFPILGPSLAERTSTFLASARAGLKPTTPPVEAPINPARTRKGHPTVNVPTDKMAAFLSEMKSVRLRKVSGGMLPPGAGAASRSASDGSSRWAYGERSFDVGAARIGEKRKREGAAGESSLPSKRRFTTFSLPDTSGDASFTSSSSRALHDARQPAPGPSSFLQSYPGPQGIPPRGWPSISTTETDITTPSLCSDNENEPEGDSEERLPPTPPAATHEANVEAAQAKDPPPRRRKSAPPPPGSEIIDVDMEPSPEPPQIVHPLPESGHKASPSPEPDVSQVRNTRAQGDSIHPPSRDPFARRVPSSPLPADTPRKPRPPARARAKPMRVVSADEDVSGSDDPLSLPLSPRLVPVGLHASSDTAPDRPPPKKNRRKEASRLPVAARAPVPVSVPAPASVLSRKLSVSSTHSAPAVGSSMRRRRRRTLDQELQRAGDALWTEGDADGEVKAEAEMESGELVGVGMRSTKRGFLKGGGAGGMPVFMGVGYVEGAEESTEEREEDEEYVPQRRKVRARR
ncbi:hypothetical protein SCP_1303230 [Sparassis crispa]|uniref:Uncharacterized protein n=1 Tax=Sparassis crispa TaxID=139825 RepID=A0A401H239_9APHY|nr:hypothetical protein SCP_1303230 [Sparassis crispa]GBE88507.1 hypothetical protein SCP_1303230 [Sparassis crispa]